MNILQKFEAKEFEKIKENKDIPAFGPGDTIRVNVRVKEGTRERIQAFEGVCISRTGTTMNENFTVRKISLGEGVERVFPLWSSRIDSIEVVRLGSVRRAKLYYLRDRRGKSARITERTTGHGFEKEDDKAKTEISKTEQRKQKKAEKKAERAERAKVHDKVKADKEAAKAAEKKAAADAAAAEAPANTPAEGDKAE